MKKPSYKRNPFLHSTEQGCYNPLTNRDIRKGTDLYKALSSGDFLRDEVQQGAVFESLIDQQFIVPVDADLSQEYLLKYVSIETHTICNQKCYFCPVSVHTRDRHVMDFDQFERIAAQLTQPHSAFSGVFLNGYNEPSIDPNFLRQVSLLNNLGIPVAVNSNGSGLRPDIVDAMQASGGLAYLSINLSTLDRQQYIADRQADHLPSVIRNLDYLAQSKLAPDMQIVVLGTDDDKHDRAYTEVHDRYAKTNFSIKRYKVNSRSGRIDVYQQTESPHRKLKGCEQTGSRPLQHLHINAYGQCVLCCQDYHDEYVVGDLNEQSIDEVLSGPKMAQFRRWAYGIEEAPDDFICRHCSFAITE